MKATAWAPVNVALIKYWGKDDLRFRLPSNSSFSVCLKRLGTLTTVEFSQDFIKDKVGIDGSIAEERDLDRVVGHVDHMRKLRGVQYPVQIESKNNFPMSVGLSSSASGFAALSKATDSALELGLSPRQLSRIARMGSGSASRSVPDGWVEWRAGTSDVSSYSESIFPADHWDLRVLVILLSQDEKRVSSTDGHAAAQTSPFFKVRKREIRKKLVNMKTFVQERNFSLFGELLEDEALNMHAVMLTSKPNLIYWLPETVRVMQAIQDWRAQGLESYFTINTGQNVFVFCKPKDENRLVRKLSRLEGVIEIRRDSIGRGAKIIKKHLF